MPKYAVLDDLYRVVEIRVCEDHEVSKTKLLPDGGPRARPYVEEERPDVSPYQTATTRYDIQKDSVTLTWDVQAPDAGAYKNAVKAEARRRITAVFPEWKQMNMTARAVELLTVQPLSGADLAEYEALQLARAWIKSVRAASNVLETADPTANVADDSLWPEYESN